MILFCFSGKLNVECWFPAYFTENMIKSGTKTCATKEEHYIIDGRNITKANISSFKGHTKNIFYQTATTTEVLVTSQVVLVVVAFVLLRNVACRAGTQARVLVAGLGGSPLQVDAARGLRKGFCTTVTYVLIQVRLWLTNCCF